MKITLKPLLIAFVILTGLTGLFLNSCKDDDDDDQTVENGKIKISFYHTIDNVNVEFNNLKYINEAGNHYMVTDFQYFISDVVLTRSDGQKTHIDDWNDIFYVDSQDSSTMTWNVLDPIPVGHYDSISFLFGISKEKNVTGLFVNPPEVNMFWPDFLGGGYHYMKLNGKWEDTTGLAVPFNMHAGIGLEINGNDTTPHHTCFRVNLPSSSFDISKDQTTTIGIQMNIESWFKTPNTWDWDVTGGAIMQDWQLIQKAMENGHDVFTRK